MSECVAKNPHAFDLDEFERRLRAGSPARRLQPSLQAGSDPLAELVRLVGGGGEGARPDPFEASLRAQKAVPETLATPEAPHVEISSSVGVSQADYGPRLDQGTGRIPDAGSWAEPDRGSGPEFAPLADGAAMPGARGGKQVVYVMTALLIGGAVMLAGGIVLKTGGSSGDGAAGLAVGGPARTEPVSQENADSGQALLDHKDDNASVGVESMADRHVDPSTPDPQAQAAAAVVSADAQVSANAPPLADIGQIEQKKVKTVSVRADGNLPDVGAASHPQRSTLPSMVGGFPVSPVKAAVRAPSIPRPAAGATAPRKRGQ